MGSATNMRLAMCDNRGGSNGHDLGGSMSRKELGVKRDVPRAERIESVDRHRQWQKTLNQRDFFDRVFGARNTNVSSD